MKVQVLKDVLVAVDALGVKTRQLTAGSTDHINDDLFAGLEAEGYVAALDGDVIVGDGTGEALPAIDETDGGYIVPPPVIEIPADWQKSHHKTRVALAKKISGGDVASADEADKIIAAEVARRTGE